MQIRSGKRPLDVRPGIELDNVSDGETIYQRSLLLKGRSHEYCKAGDYLCVSVADFTGSIPSSQAWPIRDGHFSALIKLSAGENTVTLKKHDCGGRVKQELSIKLQHVALTQIPPLHLAILVAKDSPLAIDCPPYKGAGISSTHSGLDAAINKLRTTAYMWQACVAEDMRRHGLGRRSFRLEEEWTVDTTEQRAQGTPTQRANVLNSAPRVHIIRSEKTVAELRKPEYANPNEGMSDDSYNNAERNGSPETRNELHWLFEDALTKSPTTLWDNDSRQVVAGMLLDSTYDLEEAKVLCHAPMGCHSREHASVATFGSHLAWAWPRFFDEIAACLTDSTNPSDIVAHWSSSVAVQRERQSWQACSFGQTAFLREIGRAFGASHMNTGVMKPHAYMIEWPRHFVADTEPLSADMPPSSSSSPSTTPGSEDDNRRTMRSRETQSKRTEAPHLFDLRDALAFRSLPQFRLPGDRAIYSVSAPVMDGAPVIRRVTSEEAKSVTVPGEDPSEDMKLCIVCAVGIHSIDVPGLALPEDEAAMNGTQTKYILDVSSIAPGTITPITVLGSTGRSAHVANLFDVLGYADQIPVPGTNVTLGRLGSRAFLSACDDAVARTAASQAGHVQWAALLEHMDASGNRHRATGIDLRVGCTMDGAVLRYDPLTKDERAKRATRDTANNPKTANRYDPNYYFGDDDPEDNDDKHDDHGCYKPKSGGITVNLGPAKDRNGEPWAFGGHQAQVVELSDATGHFSIAKVELNNRCAVYGDGARRDQEAGLEESRKKQKEAGDEQKHIELNNTNSLDGIRLTFWDTGRPTLPHPFAARVNRGGALNLCHEGRDEDVAYEKKYAVRKQVSLNLPRDEDEDDDMDMDVDIRIKRDRWRRENRAGHGDNARIAAVHVSREMADMRAAGVAGTVFRPSPVTSEVRPQSSDKADDAHADGIRARAFGVEVLSAGPGQHIVGFFGTSDRQTGYCMEFGILTASVPVDQLPDEAFRMPMFDNSQSVGYGW